MTDARCPLCAEPLPAGAATGVCSWCLYGSAEEATDASSLSLPESIGGYPISGLLGQGGFGVVYLARHPTLGHDLALKVSKQRFSDEVELAHFQQEVALLAQLDLPNVVRIFDSGIDDGHLYFTMPVMSGGTLRRRMGTPEDPWTAAALMTKLARAVHSLHTHPLRVLHRDLKPENILFDQRDTPFISDFGIAAVASDDGWARNDVGIGCPAYVAPEQAFTDQGELTPATDVYSLGAIFYELLTGTPPHTGDTPEEVLRRTASEEPVPPRHFMPHLDSDLETVCLHALKRAHARYSSADQFADDLENAAAHRPILARRSSQVDRMVRWVRRHPMSSAALLLTALIGLWVFAMMQTLAQAQAQRGTGVMSSIAPPPAMGIEID
jgi:eukaryotic-like serine/threonine-protein kinase